MNNNYEFKIILKIGKKAACGNTEYKIKNNFNGLK